MSKLLDILAVVIVGSFLITVLAFIIFGIYTDPGFRIVIGLVVGLLVFIWAVDRVRVGN